MFYFCFFSLVCFELSVPVQIGLERLVSEMTCYVELCIMLNYVGHGTYSLSHNEGLVCEASSKTCALQNCSVGVRVVPYCTSENFQCIVFTFVFVDESD